MNDIPGFLACPIQLKANGEARFGLDKKHEKIPGLLMVYAWHVHDPQRTELYALTYGEALSLLESRHHTETASWTDHSNYWLRVNDTWRDLLGPYRMTPDLWSSKIRLAAQGTASTPTSDSAS